VLCALLEESAALRAAATRAKGSPAAAVMAKRCEGEGMEAAAITMGAPTPAGGCGKGTSMRFLLDEEEEEEDDLVS